MPLSEQGILGLMRERGRLASAPSVAVPLRSCRQETILGLPRDAIPQATLDEAAEGPGDGLVGPSMVTSVGLQESEDDNLEEVVMVEFAMSINRQLEKKPRRTRRHVLGFSEEGALPSFAELNEGWLEIAWTSTSPLRRPRMLLLLQPVEPASSRLQSWSRSRKIQEAMDRRFQALGKVHHRLQDPPLQATAKAAGQPLPRPQPGHAADKPELCGARDRMEDLGGMREQVGPPPRRLGDEPGRTGEVAAEARGYRPKQIPRQHLSTIFSRWPLSKSVKATAQTPVMQQSGGSKEKEAGWSSTSRGGRGMEAAERLISAMKAHPEACHKKMESRMLKAVDAVEMTSAVPLQFARSCPVGKSRTAGYWFRALRTSTALSWRTSPAKLGSRCC